MKFFIILGVFGVVATVWKNNIEIVTKKYVVRKIVVESTIFLF